MTPTGAEYLEACASWDAVAGEARLYGSDGGCPGLARRDDPDWRAWAAYRRTWTSLWEASRVAKGAAAAFGCPSRTGQYPWQQCTPQVVAVVGGAGDCTGALVAPDVVLTAGHCADATEVLASNNVAAGRVPDFRAERRVRRAVRHPLLDVAVLSLDAPLPFDPLIWPVTPTPLPDAVLVYGFGESAPDRGDFGTLVGSWFVEDQVEACPGPGTARRGCRGGDEFILADAGRDSAPGDSGAPVLEQVGDGWRLVGVTSRSLLGGATGDGGIYTRVDAISDWLISSIRRLARR